MVEVDGTGRPSRSEVPGDRDRARVEAAGGELGAQGDDPRAHGVGRPVRVGVRPAGARLEGIEPAVPVAAEEAVQMPAADPVLGRRGGDGQLR